MHRSFFMHIILCVSMLSGIAGTIIASEGGGAPFPVATLDSKRPPTPPRRSPHARTPSPGRHVIHVQPSPRRGAKVSPSPRGSATSPLDHAEITFGLVGDPSAAAPSALGSAAHAPNSSPKGPRRSTPSPSRRGAIDPLSAHAMATAAAAAAAASSDLTFTDNPLYTGGAPGEGDPLTEVDLADITPQVTPANMQMLLANAYPALKGDPKLLAKLAAQFAQDPTKQMKRRVNLLTFNALPKTITTPGATPAATREEQSPALGTVAPHQGHDLIANQVIGVLMTRNKQSSAQCRKACYGLIVALLTAGLTALSPIMAGCSQ